MRDNLLDDLPPIAGKHSPLSQPFLTAEEMAENPQDNTHNTKDKTQNARAETMQLLQGEIIWDWYSAKNNCRCQGAVIATQTHDSTGLPAVE